MRTDTLKIFELEVNYISRLDKYCIALNTDGSVKNLHWMSIVCLSFCRELNENTKKTNSRFVKLLPESSKTYSKSASLFTALTLEGWSAWGFSLSQCLFTFFFSPGMISKLKSFQQELMFLRDSLFLLQGLYGLVCCVAWFCVETSLFYQTKQVSIFWQF